MAKARWLFKEENQSVLIECPGCKMDHVINVNPERSFQNDEGQTVKMPCWTFNGNMDSPTFQPSLLWRTGKYCMSEKAINEMRQAEPERFEFMERISKICHSFIRDGKIQFLGDCTHDMKNQTVDLLDVKPFEFPPESPVQ